MTSERPSDRDWAIRTRIYEHFVERGRPPDYQEVAGGFGIDPEEARLAFHRLHEAHTLFLDPGSDLVRMANPFSAIPTPFHVEVGECFYFANCAWDALAIPALLGRDATIHARLEVAGARVRIPVVDGRPRPVEDYLIHFSIPFRNWYDDLIHT